MLHICSFCTFSYPTSSHLKICTACQFTVCLTCCSHSQIKTKIHSKLVADTEVVHEVCPCCAKTLISENDVVTLDSKEELRQLQACQVVNPKQIRI